MHSYNQYPEDDTEALLPTLIINVNGFSMDGFCHQKSSRSSAEIPSGDTREKRVKFLDHDNVTEIKHIADYDEEEVKAIWYTDREYKKIKRRCEKIVEMIERGYEVPDEDPNYCVRGLECRTFGERRLMVQRVRDIRRAVRTEQKNQRFYGIYDEESIASRSRRLSMDCCSDAIFFALLDETQANRCLGRDNQKFQRCCDSRLYDS
mmetsp:Transcript_21110/g.33975  ORF Transcript_21110/g.33975 Transcript_21110/m.33975 type:complete len:206 (+) Transcript_21110:66-683(+)